MFGKPDACQNAQFSCQVDSTEAPETPETPESNEKHI